MPRPDNKPEKPEVKPAKWFLDGDMLRLTDTPVSIIRNPGAGPYDARFVVRVDHPTFLPMPMQTLEAAKDQGEELAKELKEFPMPAVPDAT